MKIYIMTDMEGICGIRRASDVQRGSATYPHGQKLLMGDINAAIAGAFDGGATEVLVCDGHGTGHNFVLSEMDGRANYTEPSGATNIFGGLDRSFDGAFLIGYHAMAGTERAFLDHTMSSASVYEYTINGVPTGEIGMMAYLAGAEDVPAVFLTGDRAACEEAEALIPGLPTVSVKDAFYRERVRLIHPERGRKLIRDGAAAAVRALADNRPPPLKLDPPIQLTYTLYKTDMIDNKLRGRTDLERIGGRTVAMTVDRQHDILLIL